MPKHCGSESDIFYSAQEDTNNTMKSETISNPWKLQYDEVLEQYHYINVIDNTITFDLPCEVNYTPELIKPRSIFHIKKRSNSSRILGLEMCKQTSWGSSDSSLLETSKKKSLLGKLGSVLRHKHRPEVADIDVIAAKETEKETYNTEESDEEMSDVNNYNYDRTIGVSTESFGDVDSMISGLDDAYLLDKSSNLKNFAGTSVNNDAYYESFSSNSSSNSIHSYYSNLPYEYQEIDGSALDYDKERERYELRLQFREELEI